ncbi:hypothetical protein E2C01_045671 [Portunus trituberculatus]|uniref:Uncharacterized protein n=1 Tax=Portunus trituberculatus TaxID=210409 RepID=A0A5B7G2N8_PORTR|nr:hypothetical protein [Portunus trituberculatus]
MQDFGSEKEAEDSQVPPISKSTRWETIAPSEETQPTLEPTLVDRIRTRALGDPSNPKARMVSLYHGDLLQ